MTATTTTHPTVTIPAYAADTLGETLTVHAPDTWHDRVRALSPRCSYGPHYSRHVVSSLRDMDRLVVDGYSALAYDHLLAAEVAR